MNGNLAAVGQLGRGKYLKVLCADDWLTPDCVEVFVSAAEKYPGCALAASAEYYADESGNALWVQFLFGVEEKLIRGERMLDKMALGTGFGGNSSFFINREKFNACGGYDPTVAYAADYELAARLCLHGDYLHLDRPLFYGRAHSQSSSSTDPSKLLDVIDWFEIPSMRFAPRPPMSRNWFRYHWSRGRVTGNYLVNVITSWARGNRDYAKNLSIVLLDKGTLPLGFVFAAIGLPTRICRRLLRRPHLRRPA